MNLTVFAGTFNPIHIAHLILAEFVRAELDSEKILFIPSYIPPHRQTELVEAAHRYNMVKLAIQDNPYFDVSDIEFKLTGKSYTVNTLKRLYDQFPDIKGKINFIIGTDAFLNIESWYQPKELVKLANFIILARNGSPDAERIIKNIKLKGIEYTILETPIVEVSASFIRKRIRSGKSIKYLVAEPVRKYIEDYDLYETTA